VQLRFKGNKIQELFYFSKLLNHNSKRMLKKSFFKTLAKINKVIVPRYSQRDVTKLSKMDKAIVAYRYWVTINALG